MCRHHPRRPWREAASVGVRTGERPDVALVRGGWASEAGTQSLDGEEGTALLTGGETRLEAGIQHGRIQVSPSRNFFLRSFGVELDIGEGDERIADIGDPETSGETQLAAEFEAIRPHISEELLDRDLVRAELRILLESDLFEGDAGFIHGIVRINAWDGLAFLLLAFGGAAFSFDNNSAVEVVLARGEEARGERETSQGSTAAGREPCVWRGSQEMLTRMASPVFMEKAFFLK